MRDLWRLKVLLHCLGVRIRSEWLTSAMNQYADSLSRQFPRGDHRIRRSVSHSIIDGIREGRDTSATGH